MEIPAPTAIPAPSGTPATAHTVAVGQPIPPIERIRTFSDRQWEEFVLEWADSLRQEYEAVERCGGKGDMGRDVIATLPDGEWHNYQCKHYDHALYPGDIWLEIGKLVYYTAEKAFSLPTAYYFIAPHGVGTSLSNLLRSPGKLKKQFKEKWRAKCEEKITSTGNVVLTKALEAHVDTIDFAIFSHVPPLRIVDGHRRTPWHVPRFGGGLPVRPTVPAPPAKPATTEAIYVEQLLAAYSEHVAETIPTPDDLVGDRAPLRGHFDDSRLEFYSAEALHQFSRDQLPPGEFEKLQDQVQAGIMDEIRGDHPDGYRRVVAVIRAARQLQVGGHSLAGQLQIRDRGGICHQLANERKLKWVVP